VKNRLLHIVFLLTCNFTFGQQADSLLQTLPELSGIARTDALIQLSNFFSEIDSSRSISFADEAINLADQNDDLQSKGLALFNKAESYYHFDNYNLALENYKLALAIFMQNNDSVNVGETLNGIGLVYYFKGEYNLAVEHFFNALDFFTRDDLKGNAAHVYSNIGMVCSRIGDGKKAIYNYEHASRLNEEILDTASLAVNYNGLGVSYYNLAEYDSSKIYYNKALDLFRQLKNLKREAIALNNIANIYVNVGDSLDLAMAYYQQAMQVFDDLNDYRSKAFVLEGLGCVYRELGNFQQAISTFKESLELAEKHRLGFYLQQLNFYDLSLTYERMKRTQDAYQSFKLYGQYKDSLLQEERTNQVAELEKKYQTQQKEAEIQRLNASRQIDQLRLKRDEELRIFGIATILLLAVAVSVVSVGYFNKKHTNKLLGQKNFKIEEQRKELEKLNAAKDKFFSIIAHDLKNPFHTILGFSYLIDKEYDRFSDVEKRKYAAEINRSANSIFRLLQNLLDWARSQTESLKYNPQVLDLKEVYENIQSLLKPLAEQKQIQLLTEIPDGTEVFADPVMLETTLRNLVNNAIKFTHENGWVKMIVKNARGIVEVCVEDNGVGISQEDMDNLFRIDSKVKRKGTHQEDGTGLGLIICEEFVKKNGGSIRAESQSGKGSRFCFTVPGVNDLMRLNGD
jgi:signal transduction histidine kinase